MSKGHLARTEARCLNLHEWKGSKITVPKRLCVNEVHQKLAEGTAILIDVRSSLEYRRGFIRGAQLLPLTSLFLQAHPAGLPAATSQPLILYCSHGPRSFLASLLLKGRVYTQVWYLKGGLSKWPGSVGKLR